MLSDEFIKRRDAEISALRNLKNTFFLLGSLQLAVFVITAITFFSSLASLYFKAPNEGDSQIATISFSLVFNTLYAVFIFAFALRVQNVTMDMWQFAPESAYVRYGAFLLIIYAIVAEAVNVTLEFNPAMNFIAMTGIGVFNFIAILLIAIGIWKLGNRYGSSSLKLSGLLFLFLNFIGTFLVYRAFNDAERKIMKRVPPPPPPPWIWENL